jgi:RNase P subunit RPR2
MQGRKQFVVNCKDCRRDVRSGVKEFPFKSIAVTCPLCEEQRRYLPSEVFLGRPSHQAAKQART